MNPAHNEIFYTPEDFTKYMIGKFGSKICFEQGFLQNAILKLVFLHEKCNFKNTIRLI